MLGEWGGVEWVGVLGEWGGVEWVGVLGEWDEMGCWVNGMDEEGERFGGMKVAKVRKVDSFEVFIFYFSLFFLSKYLHSGAGTISEGESFLRRGGPRRWT